MPREITVGGAGFKATTLGTVEIFSFSVATSPLILAPPAGKVLRLNSLSGNGDATISVGGNQIISGTLAPAPDNTGEFNINTGSGSNNVVGIKDAITAEEADQTIEISTTSATAFNVFLTKDYGDLA